MAITLLWNLQNLWPFSAFRNDDLRASKKIVSKLPIPEHAKQFVFAFRDPQTQSLIYILSALNLSERSASDARCLISAIKPDAVLVHAGTSLVADIQSEEDTAFDNNPLPTSSLGVIKRCFVDKIGQEKYENVAGSFVLREIFGTGFHGHVLAAKVAAEEVGSTFLMIHSPLGNSCWGGSSNSNDNCDGIGGGSVFQGLVKATTSLVPQKGASLGSVSLKRFSLNNDVHGQIVKALSLCLDPPLLSGDSSSVENEIKPRSSYDTPAFAKSIYPLLEDLHDLFSDLPSIGKALAHVQKMLVDVSSGEVLDARTVSEVYTFRIAVEGLRIGLSKNGLRPIKGKRVPNKGEVEFSELPLEDKSHALFAQAIRSQSDKYKTIVAVVDAGALGGLRKHWDTLIPPQVKDMVGQLITHCGSDGAVSIRDDRQWLLADRPVVAVGAGATAILGASSLTKVVPASTLMKIFTYKIPASLKLILGQTQKALAFAFGPSKVVAASSGAKTSSALKAAASAKKIRAVTHSVIASAERTSISAMRTAFYEIMRKRKVKPVGFLPWATFACSMGTCTGLIVYGDGIECAIESVPAAPSIASLGRGIQHLREASQAVMQAEGTRIQKSIESLINRIKKSKDA